MGVVPRVPGRRPLGSAFSSAARSVADSSRASAPSASSSRSRRRAPTTGTMSSPRAATQAMASWPTVTPFRPGDRPQCLDQREIALEVAAAEARTAGADVAGAWRGAFDQWPPISPRDSTP